MYRSSPGVFIWHKWRKKKTERNLLTHVHLETAVRMEMVWMVSELFVLWAERTEKVSLGSIKTVVSEPIEGHQEYHIMVCWNECFIYYYFSCIGSLPFPAHFCTCKCPSVLLWLMPITKMMSLFVTVVLRSLESSFWGCCLWSQVTGLSLSFSLDIQVKIMGVTLLLSSSRQHLSCGGCLLVEGKYYHNCCVLCCVRQLCSIICTQIWAVLKFLLS